MRIIRKLTPGLVIAAFFGLTAAPALAAGPIWEHCVETKGSGSFENSLCTSEKANGGFEWAEVKETIEVTSSGTLELEDSEATGGAVKIECKETGVGTVGGEGSDSVKTTSLAGCKFVKPGVCEESREVTAKALNLGWSTKLREEAEEVRDEITSLASGKTPGWSVDCVVDGILMVDDECVANTTTVVKDNENEGTLKEEFESKGKNAKCSAGGAESGHVTGTINIKARNRQGLRKGAFFRITSNTPPPAKVKAGGVVIFTIKNENARERSIRLIEAVRQPNPIDWKPIEPGFKKCAEKKYASKAECPFEVEYPNKVAGILFIVIEDFGLGRDGTRVEGE
jgi:hypothetical protein